MSDKSDLPVRPLTRIAFAKEKLSFVPRAAKAGSEPIAEEPILRCTRTQRNVCFGAANIHAASQPWILSFVRNAANFSEHWLHSGPFCRSLRMQRQ